MIGDAGFAAHAVASGLPNRTRAGCLLFIVFAIMSGCVWVGAIAGWHAAGRGHDHHHQHQKSEAP